MLYTQVESTEHQATTENVGSPFELQHGLAETNRLACVPTKQWGCDGFGELLNNAISDPRKDIIDVIGIMPGFLYTVQSFLTLPSLGCFTVTLRTSLKFRILSDLEQYSWDNLSNKLMCGYEEQIKLFQQIMCNTHNQTEALFEYLHRKSTMHCDSRILKCNSNIVKELAITTRGLPQRSRTIAFTTDLIYVAWCENNSPECHHEMGYRENFTCPCCGVKLTLCEMCLPKVTRAMQNRAFVVKHSKSMTELKEKLEDQDLLHGCYGMLVPDEFRSRRVQLPRTPCGAYCMKALRRSIEDGLGCLSVQHAPVSFVHMILTQISSNASFYVDMVDHNLARLQEPTDPFTDTCKTMDFSITDHSLVSWVLRRMCHVFERNEITECTEQISAWFTTGEVSISNGTEDPVIFDINHMVNEHKKLRSQRYA